LEREARPLSRHELYLLARQVIDRNRLNVDPLMAAAIAMVESSGNPVALRFEPFVPHLGGADYSTGLMQTLTSTAQWLYRDMGYRQMPEPDGASLLDPKISMYFGCAYLDYLQSYRGVARSEEWIVQSYNAGPGNTQFVYLEKYLRAKDAFGAADFEE